MAEKEITFQLKLFVDDKLAAESQNFSLWQTVYRIITSGKDNVGDIKDETGLNVNNLITSFTEETLDLEITKFANLLGLGIPIIKGACDPKKEEPFIHLDMHSWSGWTKNIPMRGRGSMSATPLVATILTLWFQTANLGKVTLKHIKKVMDEIGIEDKHPKRSINNCEWLQLREGKTIKVNASEIEKAIEVAKAFCERRAPKLKIK